MFNVSFSSKWADSFPSDGKIENTPRQVLNALFSDVCPTPVRDPKLIAWSSEVAEQLGVSATANHPSWVKILSGNSLVEGMRPIATRYGGHQFGRWAGQLGDGRAIILGEVSNHLGQSFELQLKGAGPTPYSRFADGRAVLRSSLREYVASEAMYFLGVPTTRALSLIDTGDAVERDMFYNGSAAMERGAIVCRVAPSFLRFGHFQILQATGELELLRKLIDDTITRYFPEFANQPEPVKYTKWFSYICQSTAEMIVHWMRVGFVHGVMNTDNMSVLGVTIDYGPFGFLEPFQSDWTPNTTDAAGKRYCYGHQPHVGMWNLQAFAHALMPVIATEDLESGLTLYRDTYQAQFAKMMSQKMGLSEASYLEISDLTSKVLEECQPDWTQFFIKMETLLIGSHSQDHLRENVEILRTTLYQQTKNSDALIEEFVLRYVTLRLKDRRQNHDQADSMKSANPVIVPRNYLLFEAIEKANVGDYEYLHQLLAALKTPYNRAWMRSDFYKLRPEWAASTPGCATLSCSS